MLERNGFLFIATGGTIEFVSGKTELVRMGKFEMSYQKPNFRKDSLIPEHLNTHFPNLEYAFEQVCMKDGKDINVMDLLKIEQAILESNRKNIIITHGTDTMVDSARIIEKWLKDNEKVVIFVGAFRSLEEDLSDAVANIKLAIENADFLPAGVYISGSGKIHKCQEVVKDFSRNEFIGF